MAEGDQPLAGMGGCVVTIEPLPRQHVEAFFCWTTMRGACRQYLRSSGLGGQEGQAGSGQESRLHAHFKHSVDLISLADYFGPYVTLWS